MLWIDLKNNVYFCIIFVYFLFSKSFNFNFLFLFFHFLLIIDNFYVNIIYVEAKAKQRKIIENSTIKNKPNKTGLNNVKVKYIPINVSTFLAKIQTLHPTPK